jgi:pre-mRNA-splicing helicase BRR2
VHTAALKLQKAGLISYERRTGMMQATNLGKIASHYYIKHDSMAVYNEHLKPSMNIIDVFKLFGLSKEFAMIPVRENEKIELIKFIEKVPVPVKGALDESSTKINILLQAYISKYKLDGYDLNSDMVYITQSAGRLLRALFEIGMQKKWANVAETLLNLCKMVERRMWTSMTPLRQFPKLAEHEDVLRRIEKKEQFQWHHYFDMNAQQIGEMLKFPKVGPIIKRYVDRFPRFQLETGVQPLTPSVL